MRTYDDGTGPTKVRSNDGTLTQMPFWRTVKRTWFGVPMIKVTDRTKQEESD